MQENISFFFSFFFLQKNIAWGAELHLFYLKLSGHEESPTSFPILYLISLLVSLCLYILMSYIMITMRQHVTYLWHASAPAHGQ